MMKKTVFVVLTLIGLTLLTPIQAQIRFGIKGGVNLFSVHFNNLGENFNTDNMTGFQIGPYMEAIIPLTGFGIDAAAIYSRKGLKVNTETQHLDYLDIPVNLHWNMNLLLLKTYLAAGPYMGIKLSGSNPFFENVQDQIKEKSFGAGINMGGGIYLGPLQLGLVYSLGLTDNYNIDKITSSSFSNGKNRGWSITAAYIF